MVAKSICIWSIDHVRIPHSNCILKQKWERKRERDREKDLAWEIIIDCILCHRRYDDANVRIVKYICWELHKSLSNAPSKRFNIDDTRTMYFAITTKITNQMQHLIPFNSDWSDYVSIIIDSREKYFFLATFKR